jgi:hypothetical protein
MPPAFNWLVSAQHLTSSLLLVVACCGCTAMPNVASLAFVGADKTEDTSSISTAATCTVELRSRTRRPTTIQVPLAPTTRVQDVLDASRASSRFRNLDVVIVRPTPNASEPTLKLACRFDRRTRRIGLESDYNVLPGDRVIVREDTSGGLDKVMGSMLGPVFGSR